MAISINHHDITKALELYELEVTDYYLELADECIYMYWVAKADDIEEYLKEDDIRRYLCLAFQVKGKWLSAEYFLNDKEIVTKQPFTNCRYLMAFN